MPDLKKTKPKKVKTPKAAPVTAKESMHECVENFCMARGAGW